MGVGAEGFHGGDRVTVAFGGHGRCDELDTCGLRRWMRLTRPMPARYRALISGVPMGSSWRMTLGGMLRSRRC